MRPIKRHYDMDLFEASVDETEAAAFPLHGSARDGSRVESAAQIARYLRMQQRQCMQLRLSGAALSHDESGMDSFAVRATEL